MDTYILLNDSEAEVSRLKKEIARLALENTELKKLNHWYHEQFQLSQHRRFGVSSEKAVLPEQFNLFNEAEHLASSEITEETEETITYKRKKPKGKREDFYRNIPTEQVIHELSEDQRFCHECGGLLHACGHEVLRRELEIIPAQVRAVEHVQTVYGCRDCEQNPKAVSLPMIKANVPAPVIAGSGIASPSLVAFIISNKYLLALPLNRQEQELRRMNIHISRQTMANWVIYVANKWFTPVYDLLKAELLPNEILHADETTTQVILEKGRKASQKSYMWAYGTGRDAPRQIVLFEYQPTRAGIHPMTFLEGFDGYLHVDAYAGYRKLEEMGITLVQCWSHVRRKFDEAIKAMKPKERADSPANIGLNYCSQLFGLERKYNEEGIEPEERTKRRKQEAKPISDAFFTWAESIEPQIPLLGKMREAITYALNQKTRLMNYFLDGRLEISNNRIERAIRPFTIGRNNWQFIYSAKGAKASAIAYSIVETALANGLAPFLYLSFLLRTLPNIPKEKYTDCLPWNPDVQKICKSPN